jgi:site-specific DNA-cytosine methylase
MYTLTKGDSFSCCCNTKRSPPLNSYESANGLQGFPDDYTLVPHRNKPMSDGPRYKALGNSMAVPVMHWIGKRIQMVEDMSA